MRIATLNEVDPGHLAIVEAEMVILGPPTIRAVWVEAYSHWAALEGSHRIVAAANLGLTPIIQVLPYCHELTLTDIGCDWHGDDMSLASCADESYWMGEIVDFPQRIGDLC